MAVMPNLGVNLGGYSSEIAGIQTLVDNNAVPVTLGIDKSFAYTDNMKINYTLIRDNQLRFGELYVSASPAGILCGLEWLCITQSNHHVQFNL